ncbi:hypothetical protein HHK36_016246 [Tetracentron sinense]|uniref:Kri1-like C-terminal domain-containing protein n=1 Tax=Tetracentron sinense TaxID=13715 RepID=A0A835DBB4_TETSI|nr:hypothetical protein HHK36_016246 [Tetracentron sinense]
MGLNLFDGSGSDDDDISKIEINKDFARRFEHNKKREDLQRLDELKKKGLVDDSEGSSSESEDDDEKLISSDKRDLQFLDALVKIKKQDPILKQKDVKLFESDDEESEEEENGEKPKASREKPMYLKDVVAKHLIEEGPEFEEKLSKSGLKSYPEEQEELRRAFLNAAEEAFDGDGGDLLTEKDKNKGDDVEEGDNDEIHKRLDEYFGADQKLDENEMFLKNFFLNKMWIDKEDKVEKSSQGDLFGVSEDEEEIEKQEKYEADYNFRYEEGAGDRVLGHARFTEGSVRKKTNARKLQRKSKEERMAQAEFERKEELKHLKNLKKKDIIEKLEKIREIAGISEGVCPLNEDDLEEDFDPKEYDRKMKETFDADYYEAEDADPEFCSDRDEDDLEKPNFDKEDELLGLPQDWNVCGSGEGFLAAREKVLKCKADRENVELSDGHNQEEEMPEEGKRKKKRKISLREKVDLDKELEEYYKLDYEDTIGDLKTRFKYTSVPSKRYGLRAEQILMMDDKELNQYVSLKKLAPYREKEWKIPEIKRYNHIMKHKLVLKGEKLEDQKAGKKRKLKGDGRMKIVETEEIRQRQKQLEESNGEVGTTSRRSKRRRRQAELKLSQSRLMAYGKTPHKPKSKKKAKSTDISSH